MGEASCYALFLYGGRGYARDLETAEGYEREDQAPSCPNLAPSDRLRRKIIN